MKGGYAPASAASRLDAFLLPESLKFTEYNGESPAGPGYSESLSDIFRNLPVMEAFQKRFEVHSYPLSAKLLDALVGTYVDWGGKTKRPQMAIVDWKEVPTWSEFEILKERFERMGIPVVLADPRELEFDGKRLVAHGKTIDLLYRRVLMNDIVARPKECAAHCAGLRIGRSMRREQFPLQDSARESIFRGSDRRAKRALFLDRRTGRDSTPHTVDARGRRRENASITASQSSYWSLFVRTRKPW